MRLISVAGFWVACCCLFVFVERRWGVIPAFVAPLVLTLTMAEYFASNARSYGLSLGFAGVALISWQRATAPSKGSKSAKWAFAVAIFLLVATHFLNLFILVPFGIVELYRRIKTNKTNWAVCLSLLFGVTPILIFSRSARNIIHYAASIWNEDVPSLAAPYSYYAYLLQPLTVPLIAVGAMLAIAGLGFWRSTAPGSETPMQRGDILLIGGFLLIPFLVVFTCHFRKTFCDPRYTLGATIGVAILIAGFAWRASHSYPPADLIVFLVLLGFFLRLEILHVMTIGPAKADTGLTSLGAAVPGGLPILINDPYTFMRALHEWPSSQREHVRYRYDFGLANQHIGKTMLDRHIALYANRHPGAILPYRELEKSANSFVFYYSPVYDNQGWLVRFLVSKHASLEPLGRVGDDLVFLVKDFPRN